jgi:FixJ family two-component response regulator
MGNDRHHQTTDPARSKSMIYVVDDDFDVLTSLRFLLETEGFDVKTFRSAAALLGSNLRTGADCLVIDYKMPDIDGIELARRLRKLDIATPIVLFTGYPYENIFVKAATARLNHVLLKPHLDESLVGQVRLAMQTRG